MKTFVGRFRVPVRGVHPTLVTFIGGARGTHERGHYCFWTAVLKRRVKLVAQTASWGLCRVCHAPGSLVAGACKGCRQPRISVNRRPQ